MQACPTCWPCGSDSSDRALSRDPANWGPAKTIGLAVHQRGIDITDQVALDAFIAEVNRDGGIDVLAHSLAAPHVLFR